MQGYTKEKEEFLTKVFFKSGIDRDGSYLPPWLNPSQAKQPLYDMDTAAKEARMVMFGAVSDVLEKTGKLEQSMQHAARQD